MKALKIVLIAAPLCFILWIVGLFNDLPLIPEIVEDYYIDDTALGDGLLLTEIEEEFRLEMPDHYDDDVRPVDLLIFPSDGEHSLTVNQMTARASFADIEEIKEKYHYIFTSVGELQNLTQLTNYRIGITDDDSVSSYVQVRSVYDLTGLKDFNIAIEADYSYDGHERKLAKVFKATYHRKLTWRRLRIVGDH